jgi:hypothetical protein
MIQSRWGESYESFESLAGYYQVNASDHSWKWYGEEDYGVIVQGEEQDFVVEKLVEACKSP